MSKWKEYISLIPKAMGNIDKIVEGHVNDIKLRYNQLPQDEQDEIIRRRMICEGCPLNSKLATTSPEYKSLYYSHYSTDRPDLHCSICGCPILQKTASLESDCGLEYYNSSHPNNKQPLKWTKYDSKDSQNI